MFHVKHRRGMAQVRPQSRAALAGRRGGGAGVSESRGLAAGRPPLRCLSAMASRRAAIRPG